MTPYEKEKLVIEKTRLQVERQNGSRLSLLCLELREIKKQIEDLIGEKKVYHYPVNKNEVI